MLELNMITCIGRSSLGFSAAHQIGPSESEYEVM